MNKLNGEKIDIVYSCDDNYVLPLCCSIKSLIENLHESTSCSIYIVYGENRLNCKNKNFIKALEQKNCAIEFISVETSVFKDFPISEQCSYISVETYYKYLLPGIFKNKNKIIYLDCDTNILADLTELYNTNIENYYIGGVEDCYSKEFCERLSLTKYVNAGVLLFNLEKMRNDNMEQMLIKYTQENSDIIDLVDQDVFNVVLQKGIKNLDYSWNTQIIDCCENDDNILKQAKIVHYICKTKPWHTNYVSHVKNIFFYYFKKLPILLQILKYYLPNKKHIIKQIRKKIIAYYKTDKVIVIFNIFKIKL